MRRRKQKIKISNLALLLVVLKCGSERVNGSEFITTNIAHNAHAGANKNQNRSNRHGTNFHPGRTRPMFICELRQMCCFHSLSTQTLGKFYEGRWQRDTYRGDFGGQKRGDSKCPIQWHNQLRQEFGLRVPEREAWSGARANCKHWFTTSFLQPRLHLATPWVPENC